MANRIDTKEGRVALSQYGGGSVMFAGRYSDALDEIDRLRAENKRLAKIVKDSADVVRRYKGRTYR